MHRVGSASHGPLSHAILNAYQDQVGSLIEHFGDKLKDAWTKVTGDNHRYWSTVWDAMRYVDGADHDWVEEEMKESFVGFRARTSRVSIQYS